MTEKTPHYTPENLLTLLQNHGLIWVTTKEPENHTRIIAGISGDGTPDGTSLQIINPADGCSYNEIFSSFAQKL